MDLLFVYILTLYIAVSFTLLLRLTKLYYFKRLIGLYLFYIWTALSSFLLNHYFGFTFTLLLGFVFCNILILLYNVSPKYVSKSIYNFIKEINSFIFLILIANYIALPYVFQSENFNWDLMIYYVLIGFAFYNLLCFFLFLFANSFWVLHRDKFMRIWYYTAAGLILSTYGVEVLLSTIFLSCCLGYILSYFVSDKSRTGLVLARENIVFISIFWLLRSFIVQPFIVPTGSLEPTIYPGDFVLVNQFIYGLRLPIIGWKFLDIGKLERGDIVVFRYPVDRNVLYVKRVIGLPGDHIVYQNDILTINGKKIETKYLYPDTTKDGHHIVDRVREDLFGCVHDILVSKNDPYRSHKFEWIVPRDKYLVLGDNRQASNDSRFWGFVDDKLVIGRVEYVIFSVSHDKNHNIILRDSRFMRKINAKD